MTCPVCGDATYVVGSVSDCEGVYRKRLCKACGHTFHTSEFESDSTTYDDIFRAACRERSRRRTAKRKEAKQ